MDQNARSKKNIALEDSHIIPAAFYKEGSPKGDTFWRVSAEEHAKKRHIGEYDQIVCKSCEARFGVWDQYAIEKLLRLPLPETIHSRQTLTLADFDYNKLKLFFISLLWRLDASTRDLGMHVDVGRKHRIRLTDMILNEEAGDWQEYAINLTRLHDEGKHYVYCAIPAKTGRIKSMTFYQLYAAGFRITIKCDSRLIQPHTSIFLRTGHPLTIPLLPFAGTEEEYILRTIASSKHNMRDKRFFDRAAVN